MGELLDALALQWKPQTRKKDPTKGKLFNHNATRHFRPPHFNSWRQQIGFTPAEFDKLVIDLQHLIPKDLMTKYAGDRLDSFLWIYLYQVRSGCTYIELASKVAIYKSASTVREICDNIRRLICSTVATLDQINADIRPRQGQIPGPVYFRDRGDIYFICDGTCIQVERDGSYVVQNALYDGKHAKHTVKWQVTCDRDGNVWHISFMSAGSRHDIALWDLSGVKQWLQRWDRTAKILADSGYQRRGEPILVTPYKRAAGRQLTREEKEYNTRLSSSRTKVEHVNGWIKNMFKDIGSGTFRKQYAKLEEQFRCAVWLYNWLNSERKRNGQQDWEW
jgi:hypothetical protein